MCQDLNLAKTQLGTNPCGQAKTYGVQLRSHIWFLDLMKLRFSMSHHGKNSVRDKVIGNKWIYLETHSVFRVWAISEGKSGLQMWCG